VKPKPTHADLAGTRYLALQRLGRRDRRPTAELLQLYVLEGFLRRLSRSRYREQLVLKGGVLMAAFDLRRPTRDIDLLALNVDNDRRWSRSSSSRSRRSPSRMASSS